MHLECKLYGNGGISFSSRFLLRDDFVPHWFNQQRIALFEMHQLCSIAGWITHRIDGYRKGMLDQWGNRLSRLLPTRDCAHYRFCIHCSSQEYTPQSKIVPLDNATWRIGISNLFVSYRMSAMINMRNLNMRFLDDLEVFVFV